MTDRTELEVDGPGAVGDISTWTVREAVTPVSIGDPSATGGSISITAKRDNSGDNDSAFLIGKQATLTVQRENGPDFVRGVVQNVNLDDPTAASLTVNTLLSRLAVNRTMKPLWFDPHENTFTERGTQPWQIGDPQGIAVNRSTGVIYVSSFKRGMDDATQARITAFDSDFNYLYHWGVFGPSASELGGSGMRLAVRDSDGLVFVVNGQWVSVFSEDGTFLTALDGPSMFFSVAVNQETGAVYTTEQGGTVSSVSRWQGSGSSFVFINQTFMAAPGVIPASVAVDPQTWLVYVGTHVPAGVSQQPSILVYSPTLALTDELTYERLQPQGVFRD